MKKIIIILLTCMVLPCLFAVTTEDLFKSASLNNVDVKKAKNEMYQASLDLQDAKAGFQPTIDFQMSGTYIANMIDIEKYLDEGLLNTVKTSGIKLFKDEYSSYMDGLDDSIWSFGLSLSQPLFTWGKLTNAVKLYQQVYNVRVLNYENTINQVSSEIEGRCISLFYLLKIKDSLVEQQNLAYRLVKISEEAKENGMLLEAEYLKAKVSAKQIDVALSKINQQIAMMETELSNLSGCSFSAEGFEMTETEISTYFKDVNLDNLENLLQQSLLDSRTTFSMLSALSDIAEYSNKIAKGSVNWKPDVALVASASYSGSKFPLIQDDWLIKDDWNATVTVALETTVWDGGKASRDVKRTASEFEDAQIDIQAAKDKVESSFVQNSTNLEVCEAQLDYLESLLEQLDADITVKKNLLDTGYGSESDWLQACIERNSCNIEILEQKIVWVNAAATIKFLATN